MEHTIQCGNCSKTYAVTAYVYRCSCGKGFIKQDVPQKEEKVSEGLKKSRKKLISTLKDKEPTTDKTND